MTKDVQLNLAEFSGFVEVWLEPGSWAYLNFLFYFEIRNVVVFVISHL